MLKFVGSVIVTATSVLWGLLQAAELRNRALLLRNLQGALMLMANEISAALSPLNEIMEHAESAYPDLTEFFRSVRREIESGKTFEEAWEKAVSDEEKIRLREDEQQLLNELGGILGRYGAAEQIASLHAAADRMDGFAMRAEKERQEKSKLFVASGACVGLAAVILLI